MIPLPLRTLLIGTLTLVSLPALALEPFVATYQAYNEGKLAGAAKMQVVQTEDARWRVDLGIRGTRGFAWLAGLNIEQSTVFDTRDEQYRPLSQATVKHAVFTGKKMSGVYDWQVRSARWQGDVKKTRTAAIPLQDGDMSALLVNLAVIRDAQPGKALSYRVVDNGRARDYQYAVAAQTEIVNVDDLSYDAMRVARTNGGNDETIFWVANGVPTPVRILQRENGQDTLDLRLVEYQGVQ
ncbi:hypothetical protein CSC74_06490 [Pseudoxanthomonas yeongjuensis]|uniref:DUF3108 domain-containing protein n=1 Tax=Pseudoxanthomonas yeongjuensis TaxID=377616 RepID=UPI001391E9CB|nr:DUF3108 domain-containing protein [Pseudoxanthomonas yeongjuensis]KAF1718506.1 hypothetical protein CSC74_06490 [Pseudoxanthomonas yeongjuensis]